MTKMRKMFIIILSAVILIEGGITYWQVININNQIRQADLDMDKLNKELDDILKEMESGTIKIDSQLRRFGHLPMPTNKVKTTYHDSYEDALIQDIDKNKGLVLVTIIDSKTNIVFKPTVDNLGKFHEGYIAPVTFQCMKKKKGKCDLSHDYKLYINNGLVQLVELRPIR